MIIKILQHGGKFPNFHGSVTLVQNDHINLIFDTGFAYDREPIKDSLRKAGLKPGDIHYVVNSHHHFDHCSNNDLFYRSKIVLHQQEFLTINKIMDMPLEMELVMESLEKEHHIRGSKARALSNLFIQHHQVWNYLIESKSRLLLLSQRLEVEPGIFIVPTPGHTSGHISIYIHDEKEQKKICLAGDAWVSRKTPEGPHDMMSQFTYSREKFKLTRHAMERENFDVIIPGHGKPFHPSNGHVADYFDCVI